MLEIWILFVFVLVIMVWCVSSRLQAPPAPLPPPKYFLSVLVIAKNEGMILGEFLTHMRQQGFDHVFLIDNDSTDGSADHAQSIFPKEFLTVYKRPEKHQQVQHYNWVYQRHRHETEWLAVVDVDEYIFGVQMPLKQVLVAITTPAYFRLPWIMFGSSGFQQQPQSIRESFIWRHPIPGEPGFQKSHRFDYHKALFHTSLVNSLNIHDHFIKSGATATMLKHDDPKIRLHHYAIMSWEYFSKIKMTRGDATSGSLGTIRDASYFQAYDAPATIKDETLCAFSQPK